MFFSRSMEKPTAKQSLWPQRERILVMLSSFETIWFDKRSRSSDKRRTDKNVLNRFFLKVGEG